MDEFEAMVSETVTEEFCRVAKIVESWTEEERMAYAAKFPIAIWQVAGPSEDLAFAISVN